MSKTNLQREREFWQSRAIALESVLLDAKAKLKLYREACSTGEYIGGVEYSELMRRIDAAVDVR